MYDEDYKGRNLFEGRGGRCVVMAMVLDVDEDLYWSRRII